MKEILSNENENEKEKLLTQKLKLETRLNEICGPSLPSKNSLQITKTTTVHWDSLLQELVSYFFIIIFIYLNDYLLVLLVLLPLLFFLYFLYSFFKDLVSK